MAIAVRRLRIPYTVALVIVGLVLTTQQPLKLDLTPELILALLVPPLVFEAAFHLNLRDLRRDLPGILLLAVPGVIITTLIVGGLTSLVTPLALPVALVFGALISATDPVAVVALFRALGAPKRLALLVEGESLFNDGTAIVVFNLVLAVALTGAFHPVQGAVDFLRVAAGRSGRGSRAGLADRAAHRAHRRLPDRDHPDHRAGLRLLPDRRAPAFQRRAGGGRCRAGQRQHRPAGHEPDDAHRAVQLLGVCRLPGQLVRLPADRPPGEHPDAGRLLAAGAVGHPGGARLARRGCLRAGLDPQPADGADSLALAARAELGRAARGHRAGAGAEPARPRSARSASWCR